MDLRTGSLIALASVFAINQAAMRVERWARDPRVFWGVQVLDIAVAAVLILVGLPGFERYPAMPPVLGLMFVMHAAQNHQIRARWQALEREEIEEAEAEAERKERQLLAAAPEDPPPRGGPPRGQTE